MKFFILLLSIYLLSGCQKKQTEIMETKTSDSFFVGTYNGDNSKGIYSYKLNSDGTLEKRGLVAESINPSFLTKSKDNKFLFAVNEVDENGVGSVESYLIKNDSLELINKSSSGGAHPCFVTTDDDGYILVANYTGGNIGLLKHDTNGKLSDLLYVQNHTGSSTHPNQKVPHAHSAWFEPAVKNIISLDLGSNELWFSQLDKEQQKLVPSDQQKLAMEPGAGPRHLVFHPNNKWIYVVNELDCTVTLVNKSVEGIFTTGSTLSTLPENFTEENSCADIHITSDGNFVYASNRGHNSIVIYSVNKENGSLSLIGFESTLGSTPRSFALSPDENYLLVANQRTNNLVSFSRDNKTGLLKFVDQIEAPNPICILF